MTKQTTPTPRETLVVAVLIAGTYAVAAVLIPFVLLWGAMCRLGRRAIRRAPSGAQTDSTTRPLRRL